MLADTLTSFTLHMVLFVHLLFFFFNDTATTEIYSLPLPAALPILSHIGDGAVADVISILFILFFFFFFNDTATTEIYTLSLHDALPI